MKVNKILIVNRAEIALRIISTCKEMGIKTVTIYSDDDQHLPYTFMSNESYCLGSGPLSETYLNNELIIEIAKKAGADAIHPGYGFLSENSKFCELVNNSGLTFIGPTPENVTLMGDKKESKVMMEKIGVPVIPGYHGDDQNPRFLFEEAKKIGFPVLIKATAGGGGKGMRIVDDESVFQDALDASKQEATNAFGNDRVIIEKYIQKPRHIEVQVFGDHHGNYLHFYERECSIQRRHQKIIEETPSVALNEKLRRDITETALKIARNIEYVGAGTVEFILDENGKFYFLEMNTRLQVEHPVTEMVTGFDMVRLQIEVARGDAFNLKQSEIKQQGHSLEVRIYAEDPDNNFLPTIGTISYIGTPSLNNVRLDSGYKEGNIISINYDPMLAKLIVWGRDREECIQKAIISLDEVLFQGLKTNRDYLKRIIKSDGFKQGETYTSFVDDYKDELILKEFNNDEMALIIGSYLLTENKDQKSSTMINGSASNRYSLTLWDRLTRFRNI